MKTRYIVFLALVMLFSCVDSHVNPQDKREKAIRLWRNGQNKEALIAINKAIELEPDSIINYTVRVFIYDTTGEYKEEIADLTKIIELNGNNKSLNAYHQRALARIQIGQYNEALSDINCFIENFEDDAVVNLAGAYLNKASILFKLKEFHKAKEFYELAIKENNGNEKEVESQALVGLAHLSKSPYEALAFLNKAIEIDNENSIAYGERGLLYFDKLGRGDEAHADFLMALKLDPFDPIVNSNMGQLYLEYMDNLNLAALYLKKAIELAPQSPNNGITYMNLAVIKHQTGNLKEAITNFKKAELIIPEDELLLYNYAMALSDYGNDDEALSKINKAIVKNPKNAQYLNLKGSILLGLFSYYEAEAALKKAVSLDPKFGGAYYNLGYLFGELNDHIQSIHYYDKAVNLKFNLEATLVNRATQKLRINKISEGCKDLQKAYKLGRTDVKPLIDQLCN